MFGYLYTYVYDEKTDGELILQETEVESVERWSLEELKSKIQEGEI